MESLLDELWNKYLEEMEEDTGAAEQGTMDAKSEPKKNPDEELDNICDDVDNLHIQKDTEELHDGQEGCSTSLERKETEEVASTEDPQTKTLATCEAPKHWTRDETETDEASAPEQESQFACDDSSPHSQFTHSSTDSMNNTTTDKNDNTHIKEATSQHEGSEGSDNPPHTPTTHLSPASVNTTTTEQLNMETNDATPPKEAPTHRPRKKSSVEGMRAYVDYLKLDGVEVILLSPSRLNDVSSLCEVSNNYLFSYCKKKKRVSQLRSIARSELNDRYHC